MSTGITWQRIEGDVAVVTFDQPGSAANVLNRAMMEAFDGVLAELEAASGLKGVILESAKPAIFIAGADVKELAGMQDAETLRAAIRRGQAVFTRLAALPLTKVAAIHGACLGGGYEVCLACDYRVASDDRATKLGLPETALGILPAWGGSTRLPRLIGLPAACDVILGAKRLAAKPALKRGMVDAVVPREALRRMALRILAGERPVRRRHTLVNSAIAAKIVVSRARKQLQARTRGHYPAMTRALDVLTRGVGLPVAGALRLEEEAVVALAATDVCRNLMGLFFLQERSKRLRVLPEAKPPRIERTAVIGAGVMGAGIAQWLSAQGRTVILRDVDTERVRLGLQTVAKLYRDAVKHFVMDAGAARRGFERVVPAATEVPLARTEMVIEAAVETLDIKRKIFARLGALAAADTILATNTSALSVSAVAEAVPHPERVVGLHFFNPVHRMQLVEVIRGDQTSPEVMDRTVRFVQDIGKLPVVVRDRPGFLVNRILMPYLVEAGHLFEAGATVARLDEAMLQFGMPMGPLRLIDEVGVDVAHHVAKHLADCFGDRMSVPAALPAMVAAKQLGKKSGAGFYVHGARGEPQPNPAVNAHMHGRLAASLMADALVERMVMLMVNEAARCLEEQVAESPQDVDFAMIMGTGFAPFRGGPLRYADACGIGDVVQRLNRLAGAVHARFTPCGLLQRMAATPGQTFYKSGGVS